MWFLEDFVFGRAGIDLEDYLHVFAHVYIYMCTSCVLQKTFG